MSPLLKARRALWWPGLLVLGAAAGIAAVLGLWLGPRSWPFEAGVVAAVLLFLRLGRRARSRRPGPPAPPRHREKGKTIPAHGQAEYDLARDDSTDGQRWLM
jgi:membrane protein implicated in regulation of membrane protease activity